MNIPTDTDDLIMGAELAEELGGIGPDDEELEAPSDAPASPAAWIDTINIAEQVDEDTLKKLGQRVIDDFKIDKNSRSEWEEQNAEALKLARLLTEQKDTPWPNAANVKYPLLTQACIQFNARAFPQIINGGNIVRGRIIGPDEDGEKRARSDRISTHMNYQLTEEMDGWEDDFDTLLMVLPLTVGFKKTYRDGIHHRNVSEYCSVNDIVVNYHARTLEKASRITHIYELYPNEIEEFKRSNRFLEDFDPGAAQPPPEDTDADTTDGDGSHDPRDEDSPHTFYEQHRWWDLDEDGYQEPYIVTVHEATSKVVRIVARYDADGIVYKKKACDRCKGVGQIIPETSGSWYAPAMYPSIQECPVCGGTGKVDSDDIIRIEPVHYFTAYNFLPSLDGSVYGLTWGTLLGHTNETVNSTINQLVDAGTRQNTGGGFISKMVRLGRGNLADTLRLAPGEYKMVDVSGATLRESIFTPETPQPSGVLLKLLEMMIDSSKMMTNNDLLAGELPPANTPMGTTQMLLEQSLQVYSGVYKRIYRSLHSELRKLQRLNRLYTTDAEYANVTDAENSVTRNDYNAQDCDVIPECDPNKVSDSMQIFRADALMQHIDDPGFKATEIRRFYLEAIRIPEPDKYLTSEEDLAQMKDPEIEVKNRQVAVAERRQALQEQKFEVEKVTIAAGLGKTAGEIVKLQADAIKAIAEAESKEVGDQLEQYKAVIDGYAQEMPLLIEKLNEINAAIESEGAEDGGAGEAEAVTAGGIPAMAGTTGNEDVQGAVTGTGG